MTKKKAKEWECKQHFSKGLAYRFSTLLVVAGCYLIMRFVITKLLINLENMKNLMM
jgi:hypothetical protein